MQIVESDYSKILSIWQNELWPGRQDVVAFSWMKLGGGYYSPFAPQIRFWTAQKNHSIIGVLSAHSLPGNHSVRVRGLWVADEWRRQGVATALLQAAQEWALSQGAEQLWTYPRKEAWPVYEKHGFVMQGEWLTNEQGQKNCYAYKFI